MIYKTNYSVGYVLSLNLQRSWLKCKYTKSHANITDSFGKFFNGFTRLKNVIVSYLDVTGIYKISLLQINTPCCSLIKCLKDKFFWRFEYQGEYMYI